MEKGTRLSGIFDYPEAAKSHNSRVIGTRTTPASLVLFAGHRASLSPARHRSTVWGQWDESNVVFASLTPVTGVQWVGVRDEAVKPRRCLSLSYHGRWLSIGWLHPSPLRMEGKRRSAPIRNQLHVHVHVHVPPPSPSPRLPSGKGGGGRHTCSLRILTARLFP